MGKIWSADELMALTPEERREVFRKNSSTELSDVPEGLLEQAREDIGAYRGAAKSARPVE